MTRQEKYPETSTFKFCNVNPHGRVGTGDCAYRALALALGKPWETVVMEMARLACKNGYSPASKENIDRYLKTQGWEKKKQPRKPDNTKFTGSEWCKDMQYWFADEAMIANIGGHHIVCIKEAKCSNGAYRFKVHDTWDSTDGCIGNYWVKGNYPSR